jgi:hypothetical protein
MYSLSENKNVKSVRGPDYNYDFDKITGFFARWGTTEKDDPWFSPIGPELMDIEITDICHGPGGTPCPFCYKANSPNNTSYMDIDTYTKIFESFPKSLTQIAFGVDAQCKTNPDWYEIFKYTRQKDVIPNVTVADIDDETAEKLASVCGAVAVSRYENKEHCYNSIQKLVDHGMKQVNIHIMISQENLPMVYETMGDYINDPRLQNLNAIVLLSLKQKGRGKNYTPLTQEQFKLLVDSALLYKIPLGFDSCSCSKFLESVKNHPERERFEILSEPCESSIFYFYINTLGYGFPCSFVEGEGEWKNGIDMTKVVDFNEDVWYSLRLMKFRKELVDNKRNCPVFNI